MCMIESGCRLKNIVSNIVVQEQKPIMFLTEKSNVHNILSWGKLDSLVSLFLVSFTTVLINKKL